MAGKKTPKKSKNIVPGLDTLSQEYRDLVETLDTRSDRDFALTFCAYLEDTLHALFRKVLLDQGNPNGDFINNLMRNYGPLSSFNARIDVAYALGWIGRNMWKDLKTIKAVRNLFAHQYKISTFDHPDIQSECTKLKDNLPVDWPLSSRDVFNLSTSMMITRLGLIACGLNRFEEAADYDKGENFLVGHPVSTGPKKSSTASK
jgi:DNA-binding MltR family transcriptional regulator